MDPVPLIAVKPGSYSPKPTLHGPVQNTDEAIVRHVAEQPQPQSSIHEHNQDVVQAAKKAEEYIKRFIAANERQIRLYKDDATGHTIVQLVDPNTGQVIRSLPPEELLRIARTFEATGAIAISQRA